MTLVYQMEPTMWIYAIQSLHGEFFGSQFLMPDLKAPRQTYLS